MSGFLHNRTDQTSGSPIAGGARCLTAALRAMRVKGGRMSEVPELDVARRQESNPTVWRPRNASYALRLG